MTIQRASPITIESQPAFNDERCADRFCFDHTNDLAVHVQQVIRSAGTRVHDHFANSTPRMIDEVKFVTMAQIPTGLSELLIDQEPGLFFRLEVRCHSPRSYQLARAGSSECASERSSTANTAWDGVNDSSMAARSISSARRVVVD